MGPFLDSLAREDLAPATLRGYRYVNGSMVSLRFSVGVDLGPIGNLWGSRLKRTLPSRRPRGVRSRGQAAWA
jgi:hypothetical protein